MAAAAAIAAAAAAAAAAPESCALIGFALRESLPGAPWPIGLLKDYVHTSIYIYIYIYMGPHGHIWAHGQAARRQQPSKAPGTLASDQANTSVVRTNERAHNKQVSIHSNKQVWIRIHIYIYIYNSNSIYIHGEYIYISMCKNVYMYI
jgi:hypothetical protein